MAQCEAGFISQGARVHSRGYTVHALSETHSPACRASLRVCSTSEQATLGKAVLCVQGRLRICGTGSYRVLETGR
jgi:hypothetical protein